MGAKFVLRLAVLALLALSPCAVAAADAPIPVRITEVDTHSGIRITGFDVGFHPKNSRLNDQVQNTHAACVSFRNGNARDVKHVTFHFVYYDSLNNHAGEADLARDGTFTPGVIIAGTNPKARRVNEEDCVTLPYHQQGIVLIVVFVKEITYSDGTIWSTSGPEIPEHLGTPSP